MEGRTCTKAELGTAAERPFKNCGALRLSLRLWREDEKGSEKTREEDTDRIRKGLSCYAEELGRCLLDIEEPFTGCQWESDRVRVLI